MRSTLRKDGIPYIPLTFTMNGETFFDEFDSDEEFREFYRKIRAGALPTTSQINPEEHIAYFSELLSGGVKSMVHITLSSGLSATYDAAVMAAGEVLKNYPGAEIFVVDSGGATGVHGYMLDKAQKMRDEGFDAKTVADRLNAMRNNVQVWVVADNLMHLRRGGRISGAAAVFGTMLNIKPIFIFNKMGGLTVVHKAKGIKKALMYLLEKLKDLSYDYKNVEIWIATADADDTLADMLKILRGAGCKGKITTTWVGPIIGSHTGPGTLGIIFEGKERVL